jgi:serine phosphatase RsbU (regulator of sigma subunit)/tetratricopeptide (TPR) repeat protein
MPDSPTIQSSYRYELEKLIRSFLFIIPLSLMAFSNALAQNQVAIDSLRQVINESKENAIMIRTLMQLGEQYKYLLPDSSLYYFNRALEVSDKLDSLKLKAACHRNIGMVKENQGSYDDALEEYFKALAIFEDTGNKNGMASCFNDIAIIHYMQKSYELCIEYLTKSYEIKKELGDQFGIATYYTNMSAVKTDQGQYKSAIDYTLKSIELFKELEDKEGVAIGYGNLGTINYNLQNYEEALENHLKSVELHQELNNKDGIAHSLSNISGLYLLMADSVARSESQRSHYLTEAISYGYHALELARELDAVYVKNYAAGTLMNAYSALGDYKKAMEFAVEYISIRDSMFNEEKIRAIEEMDTKYEMEKKQQQIELQESQIVARDAKIKQQKTYRNALGTGFLAILLIIFAIGYAYLQKRRDNKKIREQNEKILEANEEFKVLNEAISKQNIEIIDSINYAQRIQSALLPPETYLTELLNENFILYKPRDIVSGDFYWIKQVNQYIILTAADCTGHGVPGAFMSLLGISYLNEIVQRREITKANQVLNELRYQIKHSLRQHGQPDESRDGIEMALCVIDRKSSIMQFSGAYNPLFLIRDKQGSPELMEIKADRMPIGYFPGKDKSFTNHIIQLEVGDTFYIFSDGFIDQKGGNDNKKFMIRNFRNLLLKIHEQPLFDQKHILDKTITDWMGTNDQMDDILVIGVRI